MTQEEKSTMVAEFLNLLPMETGAYHLPIFGYVNMSGMWKDSFKIEEFKFHKDWNWTMFMVKQSSKKTNTELLVNSLETNEEVFDRVINIIQKLNEYNGE